MSTPGRGEQAPEIQCLSDSLGRLLAGVMNICAGDTEDLGELVSVAQEADRIMTSLGNAVPWGYQLNAFNAFGDLARIVFGSGSGDPQTINFLCERCLHSYHELEIKNPDITKDREILNVELLDKVCLKLEEEVPGNVCELLGKVKIKYLALLNRVPYDEKVTGAIQDGLLSQNDFVEMGELWLVAGEPIRFVILTFLGDTKPPSVLAVCYDDVPSPDNPRDPRSVGTVRLSKNQGQWTAQRIASDTEKPSIKSSVEPDIRTCGELMPDLMVLAIEQPEEALRRIDSIPRAFAASGQTNSWEVSLLYFLAYGSLANQKYKSRSDVADSEVLTLCEKSLLAYRQSVDAAVFEETETYEEKVTVKPGGLFRKAQTKLETKSHKVRKSRHDFGNNAKQLDWVSRILEEGAPGRVSEILGEVKIRYLGNRVFWAPIFEQALDHGTIEREDIRNIGDLSLKARGPIRFIIMAWARGPDGLGALAQMFDGYPGGDNSKCVGICEIRKREGNWAFTSTTVG